MQKFGFGVASLMLCGALAACDIEETNSETTEIAPTSAKLTDEQRSGFHCLSKVNGSHRGVARQVKEQLADASGFQHIETRIAPVDEEGLHALYMDFSIAQGLVSQTATAVVSNDDCSAVVVSIN